MFEKLRIFLFLGVLTAIRLLGLAVGYNIMTTIVETNLTIQILMLAIGILVNALQIYLSTAKATDDDLEPKTIEDDLSETSPFVPKITTTSSGRQRISTNV